MRRPDRAPLKSSRRRGPCGFLLVLLTGTVLLTGAPAALGQAGYTGVTPPPPIVDTYVGPYVGLGPPAGGAVQLATPRAQGAAGAAISVGNPLGDASAVDRGANRVVTGWDMVTIAALGFTAVIAFAVSAGRFRSP